MFDIDTAGCEGRVETLWCFIFVCKFDDVGTRENAAYRWRVVRRSLYDRTRVDTSMYRCWRDKLRTHNKGRNGRRELAHGQRCERM
jgi:hypothetical protein